VTPWLEFLTVTNRRWHSGRLALLGDAAHTTHFTIGHGTQLAIADAISLANQLHAHPDREQALSLYGRERAAAMRATQAYARNSARWFENVPRYVEQDERLFAELLLARGSSLMPHLPPRIFVGLRRAALKLPALSRPMRQAWHVLRGE
jgi:2-polyprenyl-6-methoxyphenol hydroxylase-like FAD-dependent oxidoreductase